MPIFADLPNLISVLRERSERSSEEEGTQVGHRDASSRQCSSQWPLLSRGVAQSVSLKVKLCRSRRKLSRGWELYTEGIFRIVLCSVGHCPPITPLART